MDKLLCIIGPTGSGKTNLALKLSTVFDSVLISADSRQVYREMDIVTGKDHPKSSPLFGIDLVNPDEEFSVSNWYQSVIPKIKEAVSNHKLPIIVGGTGLYIKALTGEIETIDIPINKDLRISLDNLSPLALQSKLKEYDPTRFEVMNNSDANNPRRLIRAIEVAEYLKSSKTKSKSAKDNFELKIIGLKEQNDQAYKQKITSRVNSRIKLGSLEETKQLLAKYNSSLPALTAIGYRSIISYLDQKLSYEEMVESWVHDEISYAKRQLLYFRTIKDVAWYNVNNKDLVSQVVKDTKSWYDSN